MKAAVLGVLLAVLVPACGGEESAPPACSDPVSASTVELADFEFRPNCLTATAGSQIRLDDTGEAPHTFTIAGTAIDIEVKPGETVVAALAGPDPGRYTVTCTYHPQMTATLTIA